MVINCDLMHVLVVDDEPLILMSISRFFKSIALVKTVSTAEEALVAIEEQLYDLCFLDVKLPGMTGLDAMKIINEVSPNTKVAIMTGNLLNEVDLPPIIVPVAELESGRNSSSG